MRIRKSQVMFIRSLTTADLAMQAHIAIYFISFLVFSYNMILLNPLILKMITRENGDTAPTSFKSLNKVLPSL